MEALAATEDGGWGCNSQFRKIGPQYNGNPGLKLDAATATAELLGLQNMCFSVFLSRIKRRCFHQICQEAGQSRETVHR